jgi:hypothetical protein
MQQYFISYSVLLGCPQLTDTKTQVVHDAQNMRNATGTNDEVCIAKWYLKL